MEALTIYLDGLPSHEQTALLGAVDDLRLTPVPRDGGQGAEALRPSLAVISIGRDADAAFALVSTLSDAGTRVAVVAPAHDSELVLRALRAGAREFTGGDTGELAAAVRRLAQPIGARAGQITAVFAPKGGVGATTLAVNLASAIAGRGERTCLVDLDLQLGDALSFLDMQSGYNISDLLANVRRLDRELLDASLARHHSGVSVLAQSERIEEAEQIDAGSVARLFSFLRQHYRHVVIDGVRRFDDVGLAALDASDRILLVVTQQVPSVRNAQRSMAVLRKLGYGDTKVNLLVNRFQRSSNIGTDVIAETVGVPVLATIANDYAVLQRALHHGKTVDEEGPRSPVARDVRALSEVIAGGSDTARRGGVLSRVFGRSVGHGAR